MKRPIPVLVFLPDHGHEKWEHIDGNLLAAVRLVVLLHERMESTETVMVPQLVLSYILHLSNIQNVSVVDISSIHYDQVSLMIDLEWIGSGNAEDEDGEK